VQAIPDKYVVVLGERQIGLGDDLEHAIAWVDDAVASGGSAAVWTGLTYADAEPRRVWPLPVL